MNLPPLQRAKAQSAGPLAPLALVQLALVGCIAPRPSAIELREEEAVVLKTVNLVTQTPYYAAFAHHAWFDIRRDGAEGRAEGLGEAYSNTRVLSIKISSDFNKFPVILSIF